MRLRPVTLVVTFALGMVAASLLAEAPQTGKVYRIGFIGVGIPGILRRIKLKPSPVIIGLWQGLCELGYIEGENLVIESRSIGGRGERRPEIAAELVRLKVDVIVTSPGPPAQQSLADVGRAQAKGLADVIKGKKGIVVIWNEDPFLRLTK